MTSAKHNALTQNCWTIATKSKDKRHPYHVFGKEGQFLSKHKDYWQARSARDLAMKQARLARQNG